MKNFTLKAILIVFLTISGFSVSAQLNGNYTINSAVSTGGSNFASFADFSSSLNSNGVSGPVKVYVASGTYNEQVSFDQAPGVSSTNTVTIYGGGATLSFSATSTNSMYTLRLNGADYLRVYNLNIVCASTNYTWGIFFTNSANNNIIDSCVISCPNTTSVSSSNYSAGIVFSNSSSSPSSSYYNGYNNIIRNNTIKGTASGGFYFGVIEWQYSTSDVSNNQYINNILEDIYVYCFYTYYTNGNKYVGNQMRRPNRTSVTTYYGFYQVVCQNLDFVGNRFYNSYATSTATSYTGTFYIFYSNSVYGTFNYINNAAYNNTFNGSVYTIFGPYHYANGNMLHNTFQQTANVNNTSYQYYYNMYLYDYSYSYQTWTVRNNVFDFNNVGMGGQSQMLYMYAYTATFKTSNNLWDLTYAGSANWYTYLGTINFGYGMSTNDVAAWLTQVKSWGGYGWESNSFAANALYQDLATGKIGLTDIATDNMGANVGVTTDIEGVTRNVNNPDVGAAEILLDIKVTDVKLPSANDCEAQERAVTATIKNNSSIPLTNVKVQYKIDNGNYITETYPGSIGVGATVTYDFTALFTLPVGTHKVTANLAGRPLEKDSFMVNVGAAPLGSYFTQGTPFQGTFNGGILLDPDIVANPDKITYELTPPVGYTNAGYGTTWTVQTFTFKDNVSNANVAAANYVRTNPAGSNNFELEFSPNKNLTDNIYRVRMVLYSYTTGCVSTDLDRYILVAPRPDVSFTANKACGGAKTLFTNNTTQSSGTTTYLWDFGDGKTSDFINPEHLYATNGTYTATLIATSDRGYQDSVTVNVGVYENPTADFDYTNPCDGDAATFTNTSTSPNAGAKTYAWEFGDGSTNATTTNTQHNYPSLGEYPVTLTITDGVGCTHMVTKNVNYYAKPDAAFAINNGAVVCTGANAIFTNTSANGTNPVGYEWDFGDGNSSISENAAHQYATSGNRTVKLKARNEYGCLKEQTMNISVVKGVLLAFTTSGNCNGQTVAFDNTSVEPAGGTVTYAWEFGDGVTSPDKDPSHSYGGIGTYHVKVQAITNAGCISTDETDVIVGEKPVAFFSVNKDKACTGDQINMSNGSFVSDNNLTYAWDFGTGTSTDANPSVTYTNAGNYTIKLIAKSGSGCSDTTTQAVKVTATPNSAFTTTSALHGDGSVNVIPTISNGNGAYSWNLGDGTTSSSKVSFVHKFPPVGYFQVCLTRVDEGCMSQICGDVVMNAAGVNSVAGNSLLVYPNPSNGVFTVAIKGVNINNAEVLVVNALGEVVYTGVAANLDNYQIDLSNKAAGVYVVKVMNGADEYTQRLNIVK